MAAFHKSWLGMMLGVFLLINLLQVSTVSGRYRRDVSNQRPARSTSSYHHSTDDDDDDDHMYHRDSPDSHDYEADEADSDDELEGSDEEEVDYNPMDENKSVSPLTMITTPQHLVVQQNSPFWLHCEAENDNEGVVVIWRKEDNILYQGDFKVIRNDRLKQFPNRTISISRMLPEDAGRYTCILTNSLETDVKVVHHVHMAQAPHIVKVLPEGDSRRVVAGHPLVLRCEARGNPVPTMKWTKNGEAVVPRHNLHLHHHSLIINSTTKHDKGSYQCMADNGIGQPAVNGVHIIVLHAPSIEIKKSVINADEGYDARILCGVDSTPDSNIMWERDGRELHNSPKHPIEISSNRNHSTLKITRITATDFGKYTCRAENEYGRGSATAEIVRQPAPALFLQGIGVENKPVLTWAVESIQPITELELKYIKIDESNAIEKFNAEWNTVQPHIEQPQGNVYTVKHTLEGLEPGKYTAKLRARNTHGWGEMSREHMFDGAYYESNEMRSDRTNEAPAAEVASGTIGVQNTFMTMATLISTLTTLCLVKLLI